MPKITFDDYRKGLWLEGRQDAMPANTARRFRGVHRTITSLLRSRNGSQLITSLNAHSLFRFNDTRYQGAGTAFYEAGVSKKTGLDGTRLSFAAMPPTLTKVDYLFVAGGGDLFKIDTSGNATNWGIVAPSTNPAAAVGAAGALTGTYQYKVTFTNTTTGTRSNGNPTAASVTVTSQQVNLSAIPVSSDAQVDAREIWRTSGGGATFFLLTTIADNSTTTLTDNTVDDDLTGTELPTDNDPPLDTYEDCTGPHGGRMWWARLDIDGFRGRIAHSPLGRAEAVEAFLDVTDDDDPTQRNVSWNGHLYTFTQDHIYEILGSGLDGVFSPRLVQNAPGTSAPESIATADNGIYYAAKDGIRAFDGTQSQLVGFEALARILQGEATDAITTAFEGVVAAYGNNEYMISDGTNAVAYDPKAGRWRDMGLGLNAVFYEKATRQMQATFASKVQILENEGSLDDDGTAIPFELETPEITSGSADKATLKRIVIDMNPNDQSLTPVLSLDDTETTLDNLTGPAGRTQFEIPVGKDAKRASLRLTGSLSKRIEISSILFDSYIPREAVEQ